MNKPYMYILSVGDLLLTPLDIAMPHNQKANYFSSL